MSNDVNYTHAELQRIFGAIDIAEGESEFANVMVAFDLELDWFEEMEKKGYLQRPEQVLQNKGMFGERETRKGIEFQTTALAVRKYDLNTWRTETAGHNVKTVKSVKAIPLLKDTSKREEQFHDERVAREEEEDEDNRRSSWAHRAKMTGAAAGVVKAADGVGQTVSSAVKNVFGGGS